MDYLLAPPAISQETARLLVGMGSVSFRVDPPYVYTSGILSPLYIDNRRMISFPAAREKIISFYIEMIQEHIGIQNIDVISGTGVAAIPQGAWIAEKLHLPYVYVRSVVKGHGHKKEMEGVLEPGQRAIVIEDAISQGGSSIRNAEIIRKLGGTVSHVIGTFTYEMKPSYDAYEKARIQPIALTTGRAVVEEAFRQGLASADEEAAVNNWMEDPFHWSAGS